MPITLLSRNLPDTFRLRLGGPFAWPAARAFLSVLVPLVLLLGVGRLDLVGGAVFGALTSVYCRSEPYRQQARTLAAVAVAMVLSVALGDLIAVYAGGDEWHEAVAMLGTAVVGAVATALSTAVKLGPPGGLIFAFATGACSHLTLSAADLPLHIAAAAVSAAFAWGISIAGAVVTGLGPQRRSVAAALEATAAHLDARSDLRTRHRAAVAVENAWNSVALVGRRHRDTPAHLDLVRAVQTCEALLLPDRPDVTSEQVRVAAAAIRRGDDLDETIFGATAEPAVPPVPASRWRVIREVMVAALKPDAHARRWLVSYAVRVGVAALIAGAVTNLLGIGHAYWAAVSAVSVLQATSTSTSVPRMIQRVVGTGLGVLVGLAILSTSPSPWVLILALALLQWGAEMTVMLNYCFGLFFATPVALLVSSFASNADPTALVSNRLWATLLGAAIAVLVAWMFPNRAWLVRVKAGLAKVRELSADPHADPRRLRGALVELQEAYDTAEGEVSSSKLPTEELLAVSHQAYDLIEGRSR